MLLTTGAVLTLALLLVQSGAGRWMGLSPLPPLVLFALAGITLTYVATVDWLKLRLYGITDPHVPAAYVEARSELRKRSDRGEPANDA